MLRCGQSVPIHFASLLRSRTSRYIPVSALATMLLAHALSFADIMRLAGIPTIHLRSSDPYDLDLSQQFADCIRPPNSAPSMI